MKLSRRFLVLAAALAAHESTVVAELAGIAHLLLLMADQRQLGGGGGGQLAGFSPQVLATLGGDAPVDG